MAVEVTEMYAAQGGVWVPVKVGGGGSDFDQSVTDGLYVNIDGDTMSGNLVVPPTPGRWQRRYWRSCRNG